MTENISKIDEHLSVVTSYCIHRKWRIVQATESNYYIILDQMGEPRGAARVEADGQAKGWILLVEAPF